MKCKFCKFKGEFKEVGFEENRRHECPKCGALFIPFKLRHFGNNYQDYPAWVTEKEWNDRKFHGKTVFKNIKLTA